jgi:hypothetical protein
MNKLLVSLLMAGAAFATALTQVSLVGADHPPVKDGDAYVGPYTLKISERNVDALCIDFADSTQPGDVTVPEPAWIDALAGLMMATLALARRRPR